MITYRDSGVADRPHAAVVHHRLEDDPGSLGLAARALWRGMLFTWVHGLSLLCNIWSSARAGVCWQAALACIRAVVFPHYSCVNGWDGPIQQIFGLWSNDYERLEEARDASQPLAEPRLLNHR
jgi:hypothetical protein